MMSDVLGEDSLSVNRVETLAFQASRFQHRNRTGLDKDSDSRSALLAKHMLFCPEHGGRMERDYLDHRISLRLLMSIVWMVFSRISFDPSSYRLSVGSS